MAEKFQKVLEQTALFGPIAVGVMMAKEKGIFSSIIKSDKPLTSEEIAKENKLKERYTRELLGCLSSAEFIKVSSNEDGVNVYYLDAPAKHILSETNFLPEMNFLKMLIVRYSEISDLMDDGNATVVRYGDKFFSLLDDIKIRTTGELIESILANVQGLREKLEAGIDVIEIGSGKAVCLVRLAGMFPNSTFTATDIQSDFAETIGKKYSHLTNMKFETLDLCALPETMDKKYDWALSIDVIHDLPHPREGLKAIRSLIKSDGVYTFEDMSGTGSHIQDVGDNVAAVFYTLGTFLCIPESFQSDDSEAHGPCWAKQTCLDYANSVGFDTTAIPLEGKKMLFIAKAV